MPWEVEYTDEFGAWWDVLTVAEQIDVGAVLRLLVVQGPTLGYPYTSTVEGSRHGHMRELRIQHQGRPYRVLYAFDPRRSALLLVGSDKTGDDRWYARMAPIADRLYDNPLQRLRQEGLLDG